MDPIEPRYFLDLVIDVVRDLATTNAQQVPVDHAEVLRATLDLCRSASSLLEQDIGSADYDPPVVGVLDTVPTKRRYITPKRPSSPALSPCLCLAKPTSADEDVAAMIAWLKQNGCLPRQDALQMAAYRGDLHKCRWLVRFSICEVDGPQLLAPTTDQGIQVTQESATPLYMAAGQGHLEIVRLLVKAGAAVDFQLSDDGATPLLIAASRGFTEIVRFLAGTANASVNLAMTTTGEAPLCVAVHENYVDIVRYLVCDCHANVNQATTDNGRTPLIVAAIHGNLEVMKILVEQGHASLNFASVLGGASPLFCAAEYGKLELVRYLAAAGADVNQGLTSNGTTPLFIATKKNHLEVVKFLAADAKADVNQTRTDCAATPLFMACSSGNLPVVRFLVEEAGADMNIARTDIGVTPLIIAAFNQHIPVVRYLLSHGKPDLKHPSAVGTPLECCSNPEICGHLIMAGAEADLPTFSGTTPREALKNRLLAWASLRLLDHCRFVSTALFGMHESSGSVMSMIAGVDEAKLLVAELLDIPTGRGIKNLRAMFPALEATAPVLGCPTTRATLRAALEPPPGDVEAPGHMPITDHVMEVEDAVQAGLPQGQLAPPAPPGPSGPTPLFHGIQVIAGATEVGLDLTQLSNVDEGDMWDMGMAQFDEDSDDDGSLPDLE